MPKVLITGGAGYIGSVCAAALLDAGHEVTIYDDLSTGNRSAIPAGAHFILGVPDWRGSITPTLMREKDVVMHFAGSAIVGESMAEPGKYFQNNAGNGFALLETMRRSNVRRLIFSSSCAVYGAVEGTIPEETALQPVNPYGESKRMLEEAAAWYSRVHGLRVTGFRYFNVAGATETRGEQRRVETRLIPRALEAAFSGSLDIYGTGFGTRDGTAERDYLHVADVARAHLLALEGNVAGMFNLGSGYGRTVIEVIAAVERITGITIRKCEQPARPGDPEKLVADCSRARRELGWSPARDLDEMIESAWRFKTRSGARR